MFIVYVTSGSYSAYSMDRILLGNVDPKPLLDAFVTKESGGIWTNSDESDTDHIVSKLIDWKAPDYLTKCEELEAIKKRLEEPLLAAGFKPIEAKEVYLG